MKDEICKNCKFFKSSPILAGKNSGFCFYHCPVVRLGENQIVFARPVVMERDFCSMFFPVDES